MKTKLQFTLLLLLSFCTSFSFSQKQVEKSKLEKLNLRQIESYRDGFVKRDIKTHVIRAKYDECYVDRKQTRPDSIAFSYLRAKYNEFGISKDLENVKIKKICHTPGGNCVYFEQQIGNIPIISTTSLIALNNGDTVMYVLNDFRKINNNLKLSTKAKTTDYEAIKSAKEYLNIEGAIVGNPKSKLVYFESIDKGLELAWQINMVAMKPLGDWLIVINAMDGSIIHVEDIAMYQNGTGMVYDPDPITTAQTTYGGDYVDNNDQNNTSLQNQRVQVTLRDLP